MIYIPSYPESGHSEGSRGMSAFDPKRTFKWLSVLACGAKKKELPVHRWMDGAVPAKLTIKFSDDTPDISEHTIPANRAIERIDHAETLFINFLEE